MLSGIGRLRLLLGCPGIETSVDSTDVAVKAGEEGRGGDNHGKLGDYYFATGDDYILY